MVVATNQCSPLASNRAFGAQMVHVSSALALRSGGSVSTDWQRSASRPFTSCQPQRRVYASAGSASAGADPSNGGNTVATLKAHIRNSAIAFALGGAAPVIASLAVRTAIPIAVAAMGVAVLVTGGYLVPIALGGAIAVLHKTGNAVSSLPVVCGSGALFVAGYLFRVVSKAMQRRG